jgi:hypothetical protein
MGNSIKKSLLIYLNEPNQINFSKLISDIDTNKNKSIEAYEIEKFLEKTNNDKLVESLSELENKNFKYLLRMLTYYHDNVMKNEKKIKSHIFEEFFFPKYRKIVLLSSGCSGKSTVCFFLKKGNITFNTKLYKNFELYAKDGEIPTDKIKKAESLVIQNFYEYFLKILNFQKEKFGDFSDTKLNVVIT